MTNNLTIGSEGLGKKSSINNGQVLLCKAWINKWITPRKTINKEKGSYGLKHVVEKNCNKYISNGAFIKAAIELDYRFKPNSLNAYFAMSFVKAKKNKESSFNEV